MRRAVLVLAALGVFLAPACAFADFNDASARAQSQAAALTTDQLDNLNPKVVSDAYLYARIVGTDPTEVQQLRDEVQQLRDENAQLRSQFQTIQSTLMQVVQMLTALMLKLA